MSARQTLLGHEGEGGVLQRETAAQHVKVSWDYCSKTSEPSGSALLKHGCHALGCSLGFGGLC